MTRDSVCMADDADAPHAMALTLPDGASLWALAQALARLSYLPMPSDAWGWTVEVECAAVAVRKRPLGHKAVVLRGDPAAVPLAPGACLFALCARPDSPWRREE